MANESIVTGKKYRILVDAAQKLWQRVSFWTKSTDVEFNDGKTAETKVGSINGITSSLTSSDGNIALSAAAGRTLNSNLTTLTANMGSCKLSYESGSFYATYGSVKKKLGSPVPSLIFNKVGVSTTSNSKSYTAAGEGYVIVCEASWSNNVVTFSVMKNGSPISPSSIDGVPDRNKYIYCWSVPVKKGDTIIATVSCSTAADLYLNMYAITI